MNNSTMNERTGKLYYKHLHKVFSKRNALNDYDLQVYRALLQVPQLSETGKEDLTALTQQGIHYLETGRVAYFLRGALISEEELLAKVRDALGNGFKENEKERLVEILQIAERKETLRRTDIQRLERLFERERVE